jgi:hypothetical protein
MTTRISTSLCRIIFDSKANGALLFMTILSTDLKVLKQWGYDSASSTFFYLPQVADVFVILQLVDSILPRQKAERQAAEKAEREETEKAKREGVAKVGAETSASSISKLQEMTSHNSQTKILITQTNVPLPSASTVITIPGTSKRLRLTSAIHELGRHLQRNRSDAASSQLASSPLDPDEAFMLAKPSASGKTVQSQPDPTITSLSNISTSFETDESGFHHMFHRT